MLTVNRYNPFGQY